MLRPAFLIGVLVVLCVLGVAGAATARASAPAMRTVTYAAVRVTVPLGWPVVDLGRHPHTCVRFDRHALYLGTPGAAEDCPVHAAGRTEAILVEPAGARAVLPRATRAGADARGATAVSLVRGRARLTATWAHAPAVIEHALGIHALPARAAPESLRPHAAAGTAAALLRPRLPAPAMARAAAAHQATPAAVPGQVYTGQGFDTCSTPSAGQMSAWSASPYRAVGVYIGGANMACSQPNLTSTWVSQQSSAGWHLIPIYVGLQAPTNSCGCASLSPSSAAAQGGAAAADAVTQAQAIGLGAGNPIVFDMEGYTRSATNSNAVLAFLQGWTQGLHGAGYLSGVYSSESSGIADLVSQTGTGYLEPDEIWIAAWNNQASTSDPYVPASDWANHQRLHQYRGGHNETYGQVKLNIDSDYLDAPTAAAGGGGAVAATPPSSTSNPTIAGAPLVGQTLTESHASWTGDPTSFTYQWVDCDSSGGGCAAIAGATAPTYGVTASDVGHRIRVLETATGPGGMSKPALSAATGVVQSRPTRGYWLLSAFGNVFNSPGARFYGSPRRLGLTDVSGMSPTRSGRGYWIATRSGRVLAYGNAARLTPPRPPHPVIAIAGDPASRGYWLLTSAGNVLAAGSPFLGSPVSSHQHPGAIAGFAVAARGHGYWVAAASGRVFAYGAAAHYAAPLRPHRVRGIVANPGGPGYWLFTALGDVYSVGTGFYGSPAASRSSTGGFVGMAATPDGRGYWLVTSSGATLAYGDAATFSLPRMSRPVLQIASS
jgi:hypothetical protein